MDFKIGLEVHVALPTKTKLFCSCSTSAQDPNSAICPICMGFPGSKPTLNSRAFSIALSISKALNCKINEKISFVRKVYFYPDLPKSFQITQLDEPAGYDGLLRFGNESVRIRRIQIEEDPAKIIRGEEYTLLDFNRSGVPLVEIVTEPDITSESQLRGFMEELRSLLYYMDVDIEKELKADLNISLGENGERVEIKNITGVRNIADAARYEISRQSKILEAKGKVKKETRSYDESKLSTESSREKESDEEYGYIFEPDLVEYKTDAVEIIPTIVASSIAKEYSQKYQINENSIKEMIMFNKRALELIKNFEKRNNMKDVFKALELAIRYNVTDMREESFDRLIDMIEKGAYLEENTIRKIANDEPLEVTISRSESEINELINIEINKMIDKDPNIIKEYGKNKKTFNFIVGEISKRLKVNPKHVAERLSKKLERIGNNVD